MKPFLLGLAGGALTGGLKDFMGYGNAFLIGLALFCSLLVITRSLEEIT